MKLRYIAGAGTLTVLLAAGLFVPIGSYVPTKGVCPDGQPPVVRKHLILGDTIQKLKNSDVDPGPTAGCARQVKFVLYVL